MMGDGIERAGPSAHLWLRGADNEPEMSLNLPEARRNSHFFRSRRVQGVD